MVGPATEQAATMRKSLKDGKLYMDLKTFSPLSAGLQPEKLAETDRILVSLHDCHALIEKCGRQM